VSKFAAKGRPLATLQVDGTPYDAWDLRGSKIGALADASLCGCGLGTSPCVCPGEVCLLERGEVFFSDKVANCVAGGGVGAIVLNNIEEEVLYGYSLGGESVRIPVVMIRRADGRRILDRSIGRRVSMNTRLSHEESICLAEGSYEFTMHDLEGDGICCSAGKGAYTVTASNGMIARGRKFARSETTSFGIPFDPSGVTFCSNIDIRMSPRKGSGPDKAVTWKLSRQEEGGNTTVILDSDGPLLSSDPVFVQDCIPDGR